MAEIIPFHGIRYNRTLVGNLAAVITPPYDVITPPEQELYYNRSPYNAIRLEYGKPGPADQDSDNRYNRAAAAFQAWLDEGVLLRDPEPLLYLHEHRFSYQNRAYRRTGIVAALKLEPYDKGIVIPHERTMSHPKTDRLKLLRRCHANFSPIFGLFADPARRVAEICAAARDTEPLCNFSTDDGQRHRLWAVRDPACQEALARSLAPLPVFIADGHHRYKTALRFAQEGGALYPGSGYILAELADLQDPGLLILPTHRLLHGLAPAQVEALPRIIMENFDTRILGDLAQLDMHKLTALLKRQGRKGPVMGLLLAGRVWLLAAKPHAAECSLDVAILQQRIKPFLLHDADPEQHLTYTIDAQFASQAVLSGSAQAAFILNPTPIEAVTASARRGEKLPQKSTYFYPKLPAGLVFYHHNLSTGTPQS
jgi:uncharacterized protein (DUF1015 family)